MSGTLHSAHTVQLFDLLHVLRHIAAKGAAVQRRFDAGAEFVIGLGLVSGCQDIRDPGRSQALNGVNG